MNSRTSIDRDEPVRAGRPQASAESISIRLTGGQTLLVHQSLNELLHGIRKVHPFSQVGLSKQALRQIFDSLNSWIRKQKEDEHGLPAARFEQEYSLAELRSLRNAVEIVMLDLGQNEFFTRTGFSLADAAVLLDSLNATLLDSLHLDKNARPEESNLFKRAPVAGSRNPTG
jgi:hypothetical protein